MRLPELRLSTQYYRQLLLFTFMILYVFILIRTAWISDDACITLRTVLNTLHGYGPTFNIDERVQAYTHPLWFFLLCISSLLVPNVFYATFALCILVSLIATVLLLLRCRQPAILAMVGLAIVLSKAFVDFSTSGLENPLIHLLLIILVSLSLRDDPSSVWRSPLFPLLFSAVYLTRQDLVLLILPLLTYHLFLLRHNIRQLVISGLIAIVPILLWSLFSLVYYGFLFPNTAYAKLSTGVPGSDLMLQGLRYFLRTISRDPLTFFILISGVVVGLAAGGVSRSLAIGSVCYLAYVLRVGGDFMEGRFFTAPFVVSLMILARHLTQFRIARLFPFAVIAFGSFGIYPNLLAGASYDKLKYGSDINDERAFYFQRMGLITWNSEQHKLPEWEVQKEPFVHIKGGGIGHYSLLCGPSVHIIDPLALTDPLLSRLPCKKWRIGHFERTLPTNYRKSVAENRNLLTDPAIKHYYDAIRSITRGPIFSLQRFRDIVWVNLDLISVGNVDHYKYSYIPPSDEIPYVYNDDPRLRDVPAIGSRWDAPGNITFEDALDVRFRDPIDVEKIELSCDANDVYFILVLREDQLLLEQKVEPDNTPPSGMCHASVTLKHPCRAVTTLRIEPRIGDGRYALGHLTTSTR